MTDSIVGLLQRLVKGQIDNGAPPGDVPLRHFISLPTGTNVFVLVSGGLDSAVALYLAIHLGLDVTALQFEHFARPQAESLCATRLISDCSIASFIIPYPQVRQTGLNGTTTSILAESNSIYYSLAGALAASFKADCVIGGTILPDWKTEGHHNAMPENFSLLNQLLSIEYGGHSPRVIAPLLFSSKVEVVQLGNALHLQVGSTWSCIDDGASPCDNCPQCEARRSALRDANYGDGATA